MRVMFVTVANKSHTFVAAPLAWALRNAGHDVLVAGRPELTDEVIPTGLTGVAVGEAMDAQLTEQMNEAEPQAPQAPPAATGGRPRKPTQGEYAKDDPFTEFDTLVSGLYPVMSPDPMIDDLVRFSRGWSPDLVVWDMLMYAGPVAARACGAAHARMVLATDGVGQLRGKYLRQRTDPERDPLRDWLAPKLAACGSSFGEDVAVGQWSIDPMPPWTYHPEGVRYLPMRHLAFNGPAMAPRWVFEPTTRPRVCLTLGNSHRDAGRVEASAGELLAAVADLDVEVVATFSTGQLGPPSTLPDNVRAVDFVPLNALLPTCTAIIHHGGAGTFAAAVEHGVPQLIVPSSWWSERFYGPVAMANGLEERGAGVYVADSADLTAGALRESLVRVLTEPSYRDNAEQLRKETAGMPSPNEVVPALEELTAQHRGVYPES